MRHARKMRPLKRAARTRPHSIRTQSSFDAEVSASLSASDAEGSSGRGRRSGSAGGLGFSPTTPVAAGPLFRKFYVCGVEPDQQLIHGLHVTHEPGHPGSLKVLWSFAPDGADDVPGSMDSQLVKFCYPESEAELQRLRARSTESDMFTFVMTTDTGSRQYGFCLRMLPMGPGDRHDVSLRVPETLCFLSIQPDYELYAALLSLLTFGRWRNHRALATAVRSINSPRPPPSGRTFSYFRHNLYRPAADERPKPPLSRLLGNLTLENLLLLVSAALSERRIVIVSQRMQVASECVHALASIIYPFVWQNIFLPIVPHHLIHVVMSPTPFLAGMRASQLQSLRDEGLPLGDIVLCDADTGRLAVEGGGAWPVPIGQAEVGMTGMARLRRAKHGEFGCLRLRRELQDIYHQGKGLAAMTEKGEGSSQVPALLARSRVMRAGLKVVAKMDGMAKTGADSIPTWDEENVRVIFQAFFLRILAPIGSYLHTSEGRQRNKMELDVRAFAASQPDAGVRDLLGGMEESLLLEHFANCEAAAHGKCTPRGGKLSPTSTAAFAAASAQEAWPEQPLQLLQLADYLRARAAYQGSFSWEKTKKQVSAVLAVSERRRRISVSKDSLGLERALKTRTASSISSRLDRQQRARQEQIDTMRALVEIVLKLTSNSPLSSKGANSPEERRRAMLLLCRSATYSSMMHPALWRVLDHRLLEENSSGRDWRHALKSLRVIDFMLRKGSPRTIADVLHRIHVVTRLMQHHEREEVRRAARALYSLCNSHRKCEWARQYEPAVGKSRRLKTLCKSSERSERARPCKLSSLSERANESYRIVVCSFMLSRVRLVCPFVL